MERNTEFCASCGSILPQVQGYSDTIVCYCCKRQTQVEATSKMEYRIVFNQRPDAKTEIKKDVDQEAEYDGPVVERICPKCGCDKMSYATLQLRSADEGQTVFFTCINCKHKETENS